MKRGEGVTESDLAFRGYTRWIEHPDSGLKFLKFITQSTGMSSGTSGVQETCHAKCHPSAQARPLRQ